jgi:hypothetical protein
VTDTGIGIPAHCHGHVFQVTLHAGTKTANNLFVDYLFLI